MKSDKILFLLTLTGILILIFLSNFNQNIQEGKINQISISDSKTEITLENYSEKLIIFERIENLEKGDLIKFTGNKNFYNEESQIIVEKIWKF